MQTSNLIPYLTVLDQLLVVKRMLGRIKKEDKQFAVQLLEEVGLGDKLDKYPKELSGGERQRTAIARAFMNDPNIILADEPTASLDSHRAFEIVELISNGVKKRKQSRHHGHPRRKIVEILRQSVPDVGWKTRTFGKTGSRAFII